MTRDEIMQIEGRELDKAVAETIFGGRTITKQSRLSDRTMYLLVSGRPEEMQPLEKGKTILTAWWRLSEEEAWQNCPRYSSDISAAWEVAEKFPTHQITRMHDVEMPWNKGKYRAIVNTNKFVAYADTATEAICKAALLAVMEEES